MPPFIPLPDAPRERRSAPPIPRDLAGGRAGAEEPPLNGEDPSTEPTPEPADDTEPPGEPTPDDGAPPDTDGAPPDTAATPDDGAPPDDASEAPASDPRARHAVASFGPPVSPDDPVSEAPGALPSSSDRVLSRPVLASEALMEDLAPVEPLRDQARILCVAGGLVFALLGVLPRLGVPPPGRGALLPSAVVGAVTLFAAVARVTYRQRAVAMVAMGAVVAILGIGGVGPARGIAHDGAWWSVAHMVAAAILPATLLFRARYRAFEGARLLLGLGFLAALPLALHAVLLLMAPAAPFGFAQLGAVIALCFIVAGLPGFMGSETTAAGTFVAPAMVAAFAIASGLERLGVLTPGSLGDVFGVAQAAADSAQATGEEGEVLRSAPPAVALAAGAVWDALVTTVAAGVSALLSAVGLFQILAWKFAPAARKIDLRKAPEPAIEDRPSAGEWSSRH